MKKAFAETNQWGIVTRYQDAFGQWCQVSHQTSSAIRVSMRRGESANSSTSKHGLKILKLGERFRLNGSAELVLEDGTQIQLNKWLPRDLPAGYHQIIWHRNAARTNLIITPGHCYLPRSLQAWGWAVQLYALRSRNSWGMGDFGDLEKFGRWSSRNLHCDFILTNPLAAAMPILPQQTSPYFPSSRRFLNPLYLRVENVAGAAKAKIAIENFAAMGRALNEKRLIDRDRIFRLKMSALEKIWKYFQTDPDFEIFCRERGKPLREFATFSILAEHFKSGWTHWPEPLRIVTSEAVRHFAEEHGDRIRFHQWLQWLAEQQLKKTVKSVPILQDLPIGVDPDGADAWIWQNSLAENISIGAPPDAYSSGGQNWGMQPFIPHRLRESYYEPFRQTLQAMLRFGGGLRIDHVMGLFRLFWIPKGASPTEGTYVKYAADELLAILAIESQRAKGLILGEDLGTVEPAVRRTLRRRKVLSYRLFWFEPRSPKNFPTQALAAVSTHDLFTIAGLWNGSDLARQRKLGLRPNEKDTLNVLKKFRRRLRLKANTEIQEVILKTHQLLSKAPSKLITVSLDDALAVEERPNLPGTTTKQNWSLALPISIENIAKSKLIKKIAHACRRRHEIV